ncbi:putative transcription factor interactor and regulator AUX-IAA family [Helianthus annuus]|nr:putative transcription factor interactor and regulator AUX-IAA family [Helianthus annuus]
MATEGLGLEMTELRLGLPGGGGGEKKEKKRVLLDILGGDDGGGGKNRNTGVAVGWPPVCSYRKRAIIKMYVKVSMDGAPFLRKIDINGFKGYSDFIRALENLFGLGDECEYTPIYEDKDGDWMLVGDVPWDRTQPLPDTIVSCIIGEWLPISNR